MNDSRCSALHKISHPILTRTFFTLAKITVMQTQDLRYPIGKFEPKEVFSAAEVAQHIVRISTLPARMETAVAGLSPTQLDTPYRDGGWTVRQVVHHVSDSHLNAYVRTKWTLTEDSPLIKAYQEKDWAITPETTADPGLSLSLLKALHQKWVILLKDLSPDQLKKAFIHPETEKLVTIERLTGLYAWHGDHHLAHISSLKSRMKW